MTLNNDELQSRWKNCIQVTCHVFRIVEYIKYYVERALEAIHNFIENLKSAFGSICEKLSEVFNDLTQLVDEVENRKCKSYPHGYTHYVNKLKLNPRGFPQPVMKCARSRC